MVVEYRLVKSHSRLRTLLVLAITRVDRLAALALDRQAGAVAVEGELRLQADPIRLKVFSMVLYHVLRQLLALQRAVQFVAQIGQVLAPMKCHFQCRLLCRFVWSDTCAELCEIFQVLLQPVIS